MTAERKPATPREHPRWRGMDATAAASQLGVQPDVGLSAARWGICLGIALTTLVLVEELIKVFPRRRSRTTVRFVSRTVAAAAQSS